MGKRLLLLLLALSWSAGAEVFPFPYTEKDLSNGMKVVVIPTQTPDIVTLQLVMRVGSRNEVEPGRSGFAHFFEHLMFRGTPRFPPEAAQEMLKKAGVSSNAWTWDDQTVYHKVFTRPDLEKVLDYEADRFQNLKFSQEDFRTEALAVLGEYNKNSSRPQRKMFEVLQDTAYDQHTYKHTTMGFLRDIKTYPELYDYSQTFFDRYYRPEYAVLVLAGDLQPEPTLKLVEHYFGNWRRGGYRPEIPREPPQLEPRQAHVTWDSPTLPWLMVAYKGPPFEDEKAAAAMQVIEALAFSKNSRLYQELVLKDQLVDQFEPFFWHKVDSYPVGLTVRLKKASDRDRVRRAIQQEFESLGQRLFTKDELERVQSHLRYDFALGLNSTQAIAENLAWFVSLNPDPETINRFYQAVAGLQSEDLQKVATTYFVPEQRTVVTLSQKEDS